MLPDKIYEWDRKTFSQGAEITVSADEVEKVRQRYWNLANGNKIEGSVIELKDGREIGAAHDAMTVRRFLGLIEAIPAGLSQLPSVWAPKKGTRI